MRRIHDRVAGLDVHRDQVTACVQVFDGVAVTVYRGEFTTTARGLRALIGWLTEREVTLVVMEATGVYWKPVFYPLEDLFPAVWVVNAHHVKNVPGRKTDMADAEWLADVAAHGMVRPSFIPPPEIRALRDMCRYRKTQVKVRGQEIQRLEKVLQDAGVKLTSVASGVWSKSSREMVEALIAGERDPAQLADLAKKRMRAKIPALTEALEARWGEHHSAVARAILGHIDYLDATIEALTEQIVMAASPFAEQLQRLATITGVDVLTAQLIISEIGVDMTRFPSPGHLAAWAGVAPGQHESAGRTRAAGSRHGSRALREGLIQAARAASRTKGTFFAARYQRIARRRGPNRAAVAIARNIIEAAWLLLSTGEDFVDLGGDYYTKRENPQRRVHHLVKELETAGYTVTITPAA